jgi:hypothetical protein
MDMQKVELTHETDIAVTGWPSLIIGDINDQSLGLDVAAPEGPDTAVHHQAVHSRVAKTNAAARCIMPSLAPRAPVAAPP